MPSQKSLNNFKRFFIPKTRKNCSCFGVSKEIRRLQPFATPLAEKKIQMHFTLHPLKPFSSAYTKNIERSNISVYDENLKIAYASLELQDVHIRKHQRNSGAASSNCSSFGNSKLKFTRNLLSVCVCIARPMTLHFIAFLMIFFSSLRASDIRKFHFALYLSLSLSLTRSSSAVYRNNKPKNFMHQNFSFSFSTEKKTN